FGVHWFWWFFVDVVYGGYGLEAKRVGEINRARIRNADDRDLAIRICLHGNVVIVPESISHIELDRPVHLCAQKLPAIRHPNITTEESIIVVRLIEIRQWDIRAGCDRGAIAGGGLVFPPRCAADGEALQT